MIIDDLTKKILTMEYHGGDIVRLKDSGDEDFIVLLTKENTEIKGLLKERDYITRGLYTNEIKHVLEAEIYKSNL